MGVKTFPYKSFGPLLKPYQDAVNPVMDKITANTKKTELIRNVSAGRMGRESSENAVKRTK